MSNDRRPVPVEVFGSSSALSSDSHPTSLTAPPNIENYHHVSSSSPLLCPSVSHSLLVEHSNGVAETATRASCLPSSSHATAPTTLATSSPVQNTLLYRRLRAGQLSPDEKMQLVYDARTQLSFSKCQICEILSFCVLKHNSRIKYRVR